MKKLLAIDLDGTLLDSNKKLSTYNAEILKKCAAGNHAFLTFCSGRNLVELQDTMDALPFFHYAIMNNGGYIYDIQNKTFIAENTLQAADLKSVYEPIRDLTMMFEINRPDGILLDQYYWDHLDLINVPVWEETIRKTCTPVPNFRELIHTGNLTAGKVNIFFPCREIRDIAYDRIKDLPYAYTTQEEQNLEINKPGVDKGSALETLCKLIDIDREHVIAFGDNMNDLTMFDFAGYSVAMANSVDEALAKADYVTASNDDDGVAKALLHLHLAE